MLTAPQIPYAENTFVEQDPPRQILHVVTNLAAKPSTPSFNPEAHHEMMQAIGKTLGGWNGFDGYRVHSPDEP
jgi:hypothetical protein